MTQIPVSDIALEVGEQNHVPLGFSGHSFGHSELNWSVPDKDAFAIMHTFRTLGYLFIGRVKLFTDHKNLTTILSPNGPKTAAARLHRWGLELAEYPPFEIEYFPGAKNTWADLLSRWGSPAVAQVRRIQLNQVRVRTLNGPLRKRLQISNKNIHW